MDINTSNIVTERILSISFYKPDFILISKSSRDSERKENYRPISFINTNANILKKKKKSKLDPTMLKL